VCKRTIAIAVVVVAVVTVAAPKVALALAELKEKVVVARTFLKVVAVSLVV
jgi:hypothetical protein